MSTADAWCIFGWYLLTSGKTAESLAAFMMAGAFYINGLRRT
jgi:hypothetical protein